MEKSKKVAIGIIFIGLVAAGAYNVYESQGSTTEKELGKALKSGKPVLLYFHSGGCAGCVEQEAILDEMEREHSGKMVFVWAAFAENREMFKTYAGIVSSFPVVVVFDDEGELVKRYSGVTQKAELEGALFV